MILRRLALIGCFRASCVNSYQRGCNGKQMSTLPTEVSTSVNCQSDAVNWSDGHFAQCICGVSCALRIALFGSRASGVARCKGGGRSNRSPHSSLFFSLVYCFIMELYPLIDRGETLYITALLLSHPAVLSFSCIKAPIHTFCSQCSIHKAGCHTESVEPAFHPIVQAMLERAHK